MLRPFVETLPPEAWQLAADALRGKVPDKATAYRACDDAASFFAGQFLRGPVNPTMQASPDLTPEDVACICEDHANGKMQAIPWGNIPWGKILPVILQILQTFIK